MIDEGGKRMAKIKKVLNSSVVLVEDEQKSDFIILGKGIGYGKKSGENIDVNDSTYQFYIPVVSDKSKQIMDLLDAISPEVLEVTHQVISLAKADLHTEFNDNLYFVLADHLNFAIERLKQNMVTTNRLIWEIQNFYPEEYAAGVHCLKLVNKALHILLPDDEAVNIAFHLVNAQSSNNPEYDSARYAKLIGEIINLVRYSLNKEFHKDSIHYLRFITHIRFFVERFFTDKMLEDNGDSFYLTSKNRYQKEVEVANKVKSFLYDQYRKLITDEEMYISIVYYVMNRLFRRFFSMIRV